ncbi:LOW QUALITY PROTEIN: hypothetical protein RJ641_030255 [Dillenia turbinata]|uniref:Uncharacterized protein n=1 Tax=Dillenia turbinata TaxID=194707 RepID=A0AAN8ZGY2_9MAGN
MRTFKKFSFRGVDLDALLDTLAREAFSCSCSQKVSTWAEAKPMALIKKLRKAARLNASTQAEAQLEMSSRTSILMLAFAKLFLLSLSYSLERLNFGYKKSLSWKMMIDLIMCGLSFHNAPIPAFQSSGDSGD